MSAMPTSGHVYLVGAGPGDPELLTLRALKVIERADVVVYDRLVSPEILSLSPNRAQMINVGKSPDHHPFPQANISALLVSLARKHGTIVRLKGGDPYVFGRGSEEVAELREARVEYTVVPGITSAQGISSGTGVPLTHRGLATGVRFVTGHCRAGHELELDWEGLADPETTLAVYMGRGHAKDISSRLMAQGMPADLPVMLVVDGTRKTEERHFTTLAEMGGVASGLKADRPTLMIIGHVVSLADALFSPEASALDGLGHG